MKRIFSKKDITNIIELYNSGKTSWQVAKEFGCAQSFVINTLKRNGIERRNNHSYTTKYVANDEFFKIIDSEEKAYFLGLLYADGNVYVGRNGRSNEISIALQENDIDILEKFKNIISPLSKLKFIDYGKKGWKNQYLLKINSKTICNQLIQLGCVQNKSLILQWPEYIKDINLQRHFIRGYSDGDGSIYYYKKYINKNNILEWRWQITSTSFFCNNVKNIIENLLHIHCIVGLSSPKSNNITTTLSIGGNKQVKIILDWLYKDVNIYMKRKYNKYMDFLNNQSSQSFSTNI